MYAAKACCTFRRFSSISILVLYALLIWRASAFSNCNELKAFSDFMADAHLKIAIIVHDGSLGLTKNEANIYFSKYYTRFVKISQNQSINKFNELFDGHFSSAGIFIPTLENELINQHILKPASVNGLFNNSNSWFIVGDDKPKNFDFTREKLEGFDIDVNADVTVALRKECSSLLLFDVYKICSPETAPMEVEYKGNWSSEFGLNILPKFREAFVRRRRNFCYSPVIVGTALHEKPGNISSLEYLQNEKDYPHFDMMQRKTYNLMEMMEPLFNMSLKVKFSDSWGTRLPNGTWTGVIGDISTHKVKFAICPIRNSLVRAEVLLSTTELHTEHIRFLLRHPRRATIRNIFVEPLSPTVWWCIIALTIYMIIQLGLHTRLEYRTQTLQQQHPGEPIHIEPRWDFVALQVLEAIFMQGPSPDLYTLFSTRTYILATCIFSVMLQQFYSAFIVGSLLATPSRTITNLEALYNSSLEIGMEEISYNYEFFINTSNQLVRNMYTKRICKNPAKNILNLEQGVERVGHGGFAFHVSLNRAYRILIAQLSERAFCDLQEIAIYPPFTAGLGAPKNAIYREYLQTSILLFRQSGLFQYNEKKWAIQSIDCSLVQDNEVEVDLVHFAPALVLLGMAIGVSLLFLLLELMWKWRENKKKTQIDNRRQSVQGKAIEKHHSLTL